jgi:hypothetical protein
MGKNSSGTGHLQHTNIEFSDPPAKWTKGRLKLGHFLGLDRREAPIRALLYMKLALNLAISDSALSEKVPGQPTNRATRRPIGELVECSSMTSIDSSDEKID